MLIKKPASIASSEITPKALYVNRRTFLQGASAIVGAAALGGWQRAMRDRQPVEWHSRTQVALAPKLREPRRAR